MKKDRNSFFSGYGYGPVANNMGMGMNNFVPNQAVSASNQFYAGPAYQDITWVEWITICIPILIQDYLK